MFIHTWTSWVLGMWWNFMRMKGRLNVDKISRNRSRPNRNCLSSLLTDYIRRVCIKQHYKTSHQTNTIPTTLKQTLIIYVSANNQTPHKTNTIMMTSTITKNKTHLNTTITNYTHKNKGLITSSDSNHYKLTAKRSSKNSSTGS